MAHDPLQKMIDDMKAEQEAEKAAAAAAAAGGGEPTPTGDPNPAPDPTPGQEPNGGDPNPAPAPAATPDPKPHGDQNPAPTATPADDPNDPLARAQHSFREQLAKRDKKHADEMAELKKVLEAQKAELEAFKKSQEPKPPMKSRKDFETDDEYIQYVAQEYAKEIIAKQKAEDAETAAKKAAEDAEAQKRQQADLEERQRFDAHILSSFGNDQARAQKFTSQLQYAAQNGLGTILDNAPGTWDFLSRDPNGPKVFEKVLNDKTYFQRMFLNNRTDLGMLVTAREIARELAGTPTPTPTPAPAPAHAKPGVVPNIGKPGAGGNGAAPDIFTDDAALKKYIRDHS